MESTDFSTGSQHPHLPLGFRFQPTDEDLVVHYLKKKAASVPLPESIIAEVDLYKFDPWELPAKATFGEQKWYFFSPRDRKHPNGARHRATTSGYWKETGTDKPVLTSGGTKMVGVKKALVFYRGKPPKGIKTNWIMHEYRLADGCDINKKGSLRLDDWILCRIYKMRSTPRPLDHERDELSINTNDHHHMMNPSLETSSSLPPSMPFQGLKSPASTYGAWHLSYCCMIVMMIIIVLFCIGWKSTHIDRMGNGKWPTTFYFLYDQLMRLPQRISGGQKGFRFERVSGRSRGDMGRSISRTKPSRCVKIRRLVNLRRGGWR